MTSPDLIDPTDPEYRIKDRRIYVVVAETVQPYIFRQDGRESHSITQPGGRMAVQCGHVVSQMRINTAEKYGFALAKHPIATIYKVCRDTLELIHVFDLIKLYAPMVQGYTFFDTQKEYNYSSSIVSVVGEPEEDIEVATAICTSPCLPYEVRGILDYLPLWDPRKSLR